jgi:hypothetical protein
LRAGGGGLTPPSYPAPYLPAQLIVDIKDVEKRMGSKQRRDEAARGGGKPALQRATGVSLEHELAGVMEGSAQGHGKDFIATSEKARKLMISRQQQVKRAAFKRGQALDALDNEGNSKADLGVVVLQRATVLNAMQGFLVQGPRRAFLSALATIKSAVDIQRTWRGVLGRKEAAQRRHELAVQLRAAVRIQVFFRRRRLRKELRKGA